MKRGGEANMKTLWAGAIALAMVVAVAMLARAEDPVTFERAELTIETATGEAHPFQVEVARTITQRARGLMFRESMAPDAGMLFVYPAEQQIRMWMKNTLIPLDMLFVASDGRILDIAADAVPLSETVIASPGPARAVIELNGGTARRLGIRSGDRVHHALFSGG
jgi:uncharacterized membrane protein (UPF0127 family)